MKSYGLLVSYLGTVTILEAFTGYDIIFSERAELAISIAASLTNSIPVAGPMIRELAFGAGFHDFVLRFYTQHVFILPIVMLGLMAVHMPRFLVFDVPMVMAICGAMCLGGWCISSRSWDSNLNRLSHLELLFQSGILLDCMHF